MKERASLTVNRAAFFKKAVAGVTAIALLGLVGNHLVAQQFPQFRGGPERQGLPTNNPSTPALPPQQFNNPGLAFLRWFDPIRERRLELDNPSPFAVAVPASEWTNPPLTASPLAAGFILQNITDAPYLYTRTVRALNSGSPTQSNDPVNQFEWRFTGLIPGREYFVSANILVGPTGEPDFTNQIFPQRFYVYAIEDANGTTIDVVDTVAAGGGFTRLGNGGLATETQFEANAAGEITLILFNTTPIAANGDTLDPFAEPGNQVVYADAASVSTTEGVAGRIVSSPVVAEMQDGPFAPFRQRVFSARNELASLPNSGGNIFDVGVLTAFTYNGQNVLDPLNETRRNMIWSWPARRPFTGEQAEFDRYNEELDAWVSAGGTNGRRVQQIQVDNLNGSVSASNFLLDPGVPNALGPNALVADVVLGGSNAIATYAPNLPNGTYFIEAYIPPGNPDRWSVDAAYRIVIGGEVEAVLRFNQAGSSGWVRLPGQGTGFLQEDDQPLRVEVVNGSVTPGNDTRQVVADGIRFVRQADLSINSTPVYAFTPINVGGTVEARDVVVVAMENGRLYAIDAVGDFNTGEPPATFWVYPSELDVASDPNANLLNDGPGRIAEMPSGFDLGSALIANVNGEDLLIVMGANGKVYALDMEGRGDGTTTRRWTWPDDFSPSAPEAQMAQGFTESTPASVAFAEVNGQPTVFVPTAEGRLYAIDAAGDPAARTTSVLWAYPPMVDEPYGPLLSTPTVAFGNVYLTTTRAQNDDQGVIVALNAETGALVWETDTVNGEDLAGFSSSSAVAVPGAQIIGVGPFAGVDAIGAIDISGRFVSLNAQTGALNFETENELEQGGFASTTFTYLSRQPAIGPPQTNIASFIVGLAGGQISAIFADGSTTTEGNRVYRSAFLAGELIASPVPGGYSLGDAHSWLYAGDTAGFVYAYSFDPSLGINPDDQLITPGLPPDGSGDDPPPTNVIPIDPPPVYLSPEAYDRLFSRLREGTLDQSDITDALANDRVTRQHFEFGETLYVLVYDLPEPDPVSGTIPTYRIEIRKSGIGGRVVIPVNIFPVPGNPDPNTNHIALAALPILPTGERGVVPGNLRVRVRAVSPQGQSLGQFAELVPEGLTDNDRIVLANPMALQMRVGSVGLTIDASNPENVINGNPIGVIPNDILRTDRESASATATVPHGTLGKTSINVFDRSLVTLIFGPNQGLGNVRARTVDLAWNRTAVAPWGVLRALDEALYEGFEQLPSNVPNTSPDYPNVPATATSMTRSFFGLAANPVQFGVNLNPPLITESDRATYRTTAGYNNQMPRQLQATDFSIDTSIPRFQPPSQLGYSNDRFEFFVENPNQNALETARRFFAMAVNVPEDQRLSIATPTVDLGAIPGGGGFYNAALVPALPFTGVNVRPWLNFFRAGDRAIYETFGVLNEGNVNLLNVRVAKEFGGFGNPFRPATINSDTNSDVAYLDARAHLHSDLDPRFAAMGPNEAGADPDARVILPKARPGDIAPTRLSVNPSRRVNPALGVLQPSPLIADTVTYPQGDPRIAVTVPIGAPIGTYRQQVFIFEDQGGNRDALTPALADVDEQFAEPPLELVVRVRETRMTNRPTLKTAPMLEDLPSAVSQLPWSSSQPAALRDGAGNLFVAFSSNRRNGAGPDFVPGQRTQADLSGADPRFIYLTSLQGGQPGSGPFPQPSPLSDLDIFNPDPTNPARWFRPLGIFPTQPLNTVFSSALNAGDTLDPASVRFTSPTFPSSGGFDQLAEPASGPRTPLPFRYFAYVGEATKRDAAGNTSVISQIVLNGGRFEADGTFAPLTESVMQFNPNARKSAPALVQRVNPANANAPFATVFYSVNAGGLGSIESSAFNGEGWRVPRRFDFGNVFESVGSPSVALRPLGNTAVGDLVFTGKVRGRANAEAFIGQFNIDQFGSQPANGSLRQFPIRRDRLTQEGTAGDFWTQGILWQTSNNRFSAGNPNRIDVLRRTGPGEGAGSFASILRYNTVEFNDETGLMTAESELGGRVIIDVNRGNIRFLGTIIPRNLQLYASYEPNLLRVSSGQGANYRGARVIYDDRFAPIFVDPTIPTRNRVSELSYWARPDGSQAQIGDPVRVDRTIISFTRTSSDGAEVTRPFMRTLRPGVALPLPVATNEAGVPLGISVGFSTGGAGNQFFQIDPARQRLYLMTEHIGSQVAVSYVGRDVNGNTQNVQVTLPVRLVEEMPEQAIPIEQVGNESNLALALSPLNAAWNSPGAQRAPGLIWMFWSSTRAGAEDVYFQSWAPRLVPLPPGRD